MNAHDERTNNQEDIINLINRCLENSELLQRPDVPFHVVVDLFNAELVSCCDACFHVVTDTALTEFNDANFFLAAVHVLIILSLDEFIELVQYLRNLPRLAHHLFQLMANDRLLDYFISSYTSTRQVLVDAEIAEKFEVLRRHQCVIFPAFNGGRRNLLSSRLPKNL